MQLIEPELRGKAHADMLEMLKLPYNLLSNFCALVSEI